MARTEANRSYYERWVEKEELDLIRGYCVENVYTMPLKPWKRAGGSAVRIQLDGTGDLSDCYVCEIPPGAELRAQKHMYEELTYILTGRGGTTVWYEGKAKTSFEWQAGSVFAIPLNALYQHFNLSGSESVRYTAVTTAPVVMNLFCNDAFVFNNPSTFPERFDGGEDFFSSRYEMRETDFRESGVPTFKVAFTNFVADINGIPAHQSARAAGARGRLIRLGQHRQLSTHSTIIPGRTFSTAHRHGPGFHVLWLRGEGYALMWPDGGEKEKVKLYFGPGSMIVPPTWWWHQWAVLSPDEAQDIALHPPLQGGGFGQSAGPMISTREGGSMVLVDDFSRELRGEVEAMFADECRKYDERSVVSRQRSAVSTGLKRIPES